MALGLNFGTIDAGDGDSLLIAFTKINNMFSTTTPISGGDLTINDVRVGRGAGNISSNTAVGNNALVANIGGTQNTAIGNAALTANTNGYANTAIGISALASNQGGIANTAIGIYSAAATQGGGYNTSVGLSSLFTNISGSFNTAIGRAALQNSTSDNNTAIGSEAGSSLTIESNVTCLGYNAQASASNQVVIGDTNVTTTILRGAVTADKDATFNGVKVGRGAGNINGSTVVGDSALVSNTTGQFNTCLGYASLNENEDGTGNTAMGTNSLLMNVSGSYNTSIGFGTLQVNTSGSQNTTIGTTSLYNITSGSQNTAIGSNAGNAQLTVNNSTCVGYGSEVSTSNQLQLGNSSTTTFVYGTVQSRSDERDKTEIRDTVLGLDFINELRPVDYKWDMREDYRAEMPIKPEHPLQELPVKEPLPLQGELSYSDYQELLDQYNADYQEIVDQNNADFKIVMDEWLESVKLDNITHDGTNTRTRYHHGLIAQEVQDVIEASGVDFGGFQDHSVNGGQDVLSLGYTELIAPMIKAIQELTARINVLEGN